MDGWGMVITTATVVTANNTKYPTNKRRKKEGLPPHTNVCCCNGVPSTCCPFRNRDVVATELYKIIAQSMLAGGFTPQQIREWGYPCDDLPVVAIAGPGFDPSGPGFDLSPEEFAQQLDNVDLNDLD